MKKIFTLFLFSGLLLFNSTKAACTDERFHSEGYTEKKCISVFDVFSYTLDANTSWTIKNASTNSFVKSGTGSLENISFSSPGTYEIEITDGVSHDACNHGRYPEKIILVVSSFGLRFDFSSFQLSNEIYGGQDQSANEISIDVYLTSQNNESIIYTPNLSSAGIGTTISGKITGGSIVLKPGLNHLVFKLSGQAKSDTYIMFEFSDLNNETISYSFPSKIK